MRPRELTATRLELVQAAQELGALLDESWRNYLSLPRGVFSGHTVPDRGESRAGAQAFEAVAADSRYKVLLDRQEFQQLYGLLQTYTEQVRQANRAQRRRPRASRRRPIRRFPRCAVSRDRPAVLVSQSSSLPV